MQVRGCILFAAMALLPTAQSVHAQAGRADLRYRAPFPPSVVFVAIDSMTHTVGMPTGDMTTQSFMRSVSELSFAAAEGGADVTAVLTELEGRMTSPMGNMPITASNVAPVEIRIGEMGPDPQQVADDMIVPGMGMSPGDIMGSMKALSALVTLPGRELRIGETWVDTTRTAPAMDDVEADMVVVTHGTYETDSVVAGRSVNVLRIRTDMRMTMGGTIQGMNMTQRMTSSSDEQILWDSSLHLPVSRDAIGTMRTETTLTAQGVTMVMTGRTRSITSLQPES